MLPLKPLILLGAPRSGTNALRDAVCGLPGFLTWPCDEINYIWRHGNAGFPSDALSPLQATPAVRRHIRGAFERLARSRAARRQQRRCGSSPVLVEKTCASCLRVDFIHAVLPEACFLYIRRDPLDVVASALQRWQAPFDPLYVARKARYVPLQDIPFYAGRYLGHRLRRRFRPDRSLPSWGPRFEGMDDVRTDASLTELCLRQWWACCRSAETSLERLETAGVAVARLDYERFVAEPVATLGPALQRLGFAPPPAALEQACAAIHPGSVGKGNRLSELQRLEVERTLAALGPVRSAAEAQAHPQP